LCLSPAKHLIKQCLVSRPSPTFPPANPPQSSTYTHTFAIAQARYNTSYPQSLIAPTHSLQLYTSGYQISNPLSMSKTVAITSDSQLTTLINSNKTVVIDCKSELPHSIRHPLWIRLRDYIMPTIENEANKDLSVQFMHNGMVPASSWLPCTRSSAWQLHRLGISYSQSVM